MDMEKYTKLDLVIKAIVEAKGITPKGQLVKVYLDNNEKLRGIYPGELKTILLKLQDDEKILRIESFPDYLLPSEHFTKDIYLSQLDAILDPQKKHFTIDTLDTFDKWCAESQEHIKGWSSLNIPWSTRVEILKRYAMGDKISNIMIHLQLNTNESEGIVCCDRKTISRAIKEIKKMPESVRQRLIKDAPETESLF